MAQGRASHEPDALSKLDGGCPLDGGQGGVAAVREPLDPGVVLPLFEQLLEPDGVVFFALVGPFDEEAAFRLDSKVRNQGKEEAAESAADTV